VVSGAAGGSFSPHALIVSRFQDPAALLVLTKVKHESLVPGVCADAEA